MTGICKWEWYWDWDLSAYRKTDIEEMDIIMEKLENIGKKCLYCCNEKYLSLLFCLCCVQPVSMHYRLCLVRVLMKVLHNERLVRFSKRTDGCCAFNWSISNKNGQFFWCLQRSSFQGYDGIHKSWRDVTS